MNAKQREQIAIVALVLAMIGLIFNVVLLATR